MIAFCTQYGHFKHIVISFGLMNVPTIFQHLTVDTFMRLLLHGLYAKLNKCSFDCNQVECRVYGFNKYANNSRVANIMDHA